MAVYAKPSVAGRHPVRLPQTSDTFEGPELGLQWQWNHNPVNDGWSLRERPGYLRLKAMPAPELLQARNTLTQKLIGSKGIVCTELSVLHMNPGQRAGLAFLCAREENWIGVVTEEGGNYLQAVTGGTVFHGPKLADESVWLKSHIDLSGETSFFFSLDGVIFIPLGGECRMSAGFWKGARVGLFSYTIGAKGGRADFQGFCYEHDGPWA